MPHAAHANLFRILLLSLLSMGWTLGCDTRTDSPPSAGSASEDSVVRGPAIEPLQDDAAVLRKLLGWSNVVAYEFRGTWLECWLECEVDGEVVARTVPQAVSPKTFGASAKVQPAEVENVIGWITVWGEEWDELQLKLRGELPRPDDSKVFPFTMRQQLVIPPLPNAQEVFKGGQTRGGTGLEAGWTRLPPLPDAWTQPLALQSYDWIEKAANDEKPLRKLRVTLYCRPPQADEPTSGAEEAGLPQGNLDLSD